MTERWLSRCVAPLRPALASFGLARCTPALEHAWAAWEDGEIALVRRLAQDALAAHEAHDEANHLLCLASYVSGDYRAALERFGEVGKSYVRRAELTELVIDAYVHLGAIDQALAFVRGQKGVERLTIDRLEQHAARPLRVELAGVAEVPFADHPLTGYFPAFHAEINGQRLTAHIDTGGTFLLMGPDRAGALGIRTVKGQRAPAHLNMMPVDWSYGIADRFVLGNTDLRNVPVAVLSTLRGEGDWVIFGTNILEQFLSTVDYPNRRLILSNRNDDSAKDQHLAMLPGGGVTVPFYLWSSHFMFARGGFGERRDLNFFVDTGLVSVHPDGNGGTRQASFTSSKRKLKEWGVSSAAVGQGYFESPEPLHLGPLREDRPMLVVGAAGDNSFGGVRIDGLISHAFLKRFVWTIDFDRREYRFAAPAE